MKGYLFKCHHDLSIYFPGKTLIDFGKGSQVHENKYVYDLLEEEYGGEGVFRFTKGKRIEHPVYSTPQFRYCCEVDIPLDIITDGIKLKEKELKIKREQGDNTNKLRRLIEDKIRDCDF